MDYTEKRDFHRIDINCQVSFHIAGGSDTFSGELQNLSAKGLLFLTEQVLDDGAELDVYIVPSHSITPPMHASVKVIRSIVQDNGAFEVACEMLKIHETTHEK